MPGVLLSAAIAMLAMLAASLHPSFDALLMAPLAGMFAGNLIAKKGVFEAGARFCASWALPLGLGLYGSQLVFSGGALKFILPHILGASLLFFIITFLVAKGFGLDPGTTLLLCTGLATSGTGGVSIVSGAAGADRSDVSISLISIWTIGLAGMLCITFFPGALGLAPLKFAFMLGTALPTLGLVKAAAAGGNLPGLAEGLKLARTALMVFPLLGLYLTGKMARTREAVCFVLLFSGLALAVNLAGPAGAKLGGALAPVALAVLSAGLAALGFSVDLDSIASRGVSPLLAALFGWGISVLFIYLAMRAF